MGKLKIGDLENGKIKGIPFIVEMSNRGLSVRIEAKDLTTTTLRLTWTGLLKIKR